MRGGRWGQSLLPVISLALGLNNPSAHAAWGSIRANNAAPHAEGRGTISAAPPARPEANREGRGTISAGRAESFRGREEHRAAPTGRVAEHAPAPVMRGREPVAREHEELRAGHLPELERDRRRWDIDAERRHAYYWSGFHSGMIIGALPFGYVPLAVSGNPYYYYQGVYYEQSPSGYMVVTPPIGAVVPELPPGAETIYVGNAVYYYAAGAFYLQQPQGFVVVVPPIGITVPYLPPGAAEVNINGQIFYQADGVYFEPVMQDGVTVYLSAQP